jgi:glycosyltransferase involved in cell wall biosynthesis
VHPMFKNTRQKTIKKTNHVCRPVVVALLSCACLFLFVKSIALRVLLKQPRVEYSARYGKLDSGTELIRRNLFQDDEHVQFRAPPTSVAATVKQTQDGPVATGLLSSKRPSKTRFRAVGALQSSIDLAASRSGPKLSVHDSISNWFNASSLTTQARTRVKQKPPAPRGTYVDVLIFIGDEASVPTDFDDPHFNLIVLGVPADTEPPGTVVRATLAKLRPQVIVSIGEDKKQFAFLEGGLSPQQKFGWFHVDSPESLTPSALESFFWHAIRERNGAGKSVNPLLSIFTTSFKTGAKISVPYASLLAQTYTNWEWVIYDDSPEGHDETWRHLQALAAADDRVTIMRGDRNDGLIGSSKAKACHQARGMMLVELDHDDELTPDCLDLLAAAFSQYPAAGFFYSDTVEPFENSNKTVDYGIHVAYGSAAPYKLLVNGMWMVAHATPIPNQRTLRHIVGVPNHVRAWSRQAYLAVGGHTRGLSVGDDYDLILRTMFKFPSVAIRHMTYIQYRQLEGGTFTFLRNSLIQRMVSIIRQQHEPQIAELLAKSGHPDEGLGVINTYNAKPMTLQAEPLPPPIRLEYHHPTITAPPHFPWVTVVVSAFNNTVALDRAIKSVYGQDYKSWELVIVGDACPGLDAYMEAAKGGTIGRGGHLVRWYNLPHHTGDGHHAPRNYALNALVASDWVAHLDQAAVWRSDHLSSMVKVIARDPDKTQYVLAGFEVDGQVVMADSPQKFHVDTSSVLFRRSLVQKYGAWKPRSQVGYANDWELVSRWKGEAWAASMEPTVMLSARA